MAGEPTEPGYRAFLGLPPLEEEFSPDPLTYIDPVGAALGFGAPAPPEQDLPVDPGPTPDDIAQEGLGFGPSATPALTGPAPALPSELVDLDNLPALDSVGLALGFGNQPEPEQSIADTELQIAPKEDLLEPILSGRDGVNQQQAKALEAQYAAAQSELEIGERANALEAEEAQRHAELVKQQEEQQQARDMVRKEGAAVHREQMARLSEAASVPTDATRFWNDGGGMHKAAGFIAAFMGGFQAPKNGGQNPVLKIIDDAIRRDISDQHNGQKLARQKIVDAQTLRDLDIGQADSEQSNFERQWVTRHSELAARLKAQRAGLKDGILAAKFDAGIAAIEAQRGQFMENAEQVDYQRRLQADAIAEAKRAKLIAQRQASARIGLQRRAQKFKEQQIGIEREQQRRAAELAQQQAANQAGRIAPDAIIDTDTKTVIGTHRHGPKEAIKLQGEFSDYRDFRAKLDKYEGAYKRIGRVYQGVGSNKRGVASQDAAELKQLHTALASAAAKASSGAGASDEEYNRQFAVIPPPASVTEGVDIGPRIKTYQTWQDDSFNRKIVGTLIDEKGQIVKYDVADLYRPVAGQEDSKVDEDLIAQSQGATRDVAKTLWVRNPTNEESTERFSDASKLLVQAKSGNKASGDLLRAIADRKDLPIQGAAKNMVKELDAHAKATSENSNVIDTDENGNPTMERRLDGQGAQTGISFYKDGKEQYFSTFYPGTDKVKTLTFLNGAGAPESVRSYSEDGKYIGDEDL